MRSAILIAPVFVLLASISVVVEALQQPQPRVALVTGANKGVGLEIAKKFAADPSIGTLIVACRTDGPKTAQELGTNCEDVYLDLTDDDSIAKCRKYVEEKHGKLDILVNNAAICFNDPTLYGKVPETPFRDQASITLQTNYFGTKKLTESLLPLMREPSSRIINMASYAGRLSILNSKRLVAQFTDPDLTTQQLDGYLNEFVHAVEAGTHASQGWPNTCYGVSKLGLIAYSRILARDYPHLYVNTVDPGYCATDQNNHRGTRPAARGAVTPFLLATTPNPYTGVHFYDEQEMPWTYQPQPQL